MLGIILGCPDPKPPTWGGIPNRRELAHTSMVDFDGFPVGIYIYIYIQVPWMVWVLLVLLLLLLLLLLLTTAATWRIIIFSK